MIIAKIIADSISYEGIRLTTFELEYPRVIHSELMTHRVFSRNASSSRAIPTKRMIDNMQLNTALPSEWRMNEPGMQGFTAASPEIIAKAEAIYARNRENAIKDMLELDALGLHKQHVNRLGECHQHIKVVVTATDWKNWFGLRNHPDADPTIQDLAQKMFDQMSSSTPKFLAPALYGPYSGDWHLPYITQEDIDQLIAATGEHYLDSCQMDEILIKMSAARCARVSYNNFDGRKPERAADLALYERLVGSHPIHASPTEHQATPDVCEDHQWDNPALHGNFNGWIQGRKLIEGENLEKLN